MHKVILYHLLQLPLILAIIYLLTFLLVWVAPGDPFVGEKNMDPVVVETLKRRFHASSPTEFLAWYPWNVIRHGDFGGSMQYREWSVNDIIWTSLPVSVTLGLFALLLALLFGVGTGTLAAVKRGGPNTSVHYAAAKGAVNSMTLGVAREFAKDGIRCLSISPGPIKTPFQAAANSSPELIKRFLEDIPMGRFGEPEEIGELVLFMCSDACPFMTADTVYANGGGGWR